MKVADVSQSHLSQLLRSGELLLSVSPFVVRVKSNVEQLASDIALLYCGTEIFPKNRFSDFHIEIRVSRNYRGWLKGQAHFLFDGVEQFSPLPTYQAITMFEWGLNWAIAAHAHRYLVIHAAVIEKRGHALILPAPPGSGKSTLCAALVHCGWRLLSDELALLDIAKNLVYGMARPINLKNNSIETLKAFAPQAQFTRSVPNTNKGTVALMAPPLESVLVATVPAIPKWIVQPRYQQDSEPLLSSESRAKTFFLIAEQSFNYHIHGTAGFHALESMVDGCECYRFEYSVLNDAVRVFDQLASA